MVQCTEIAKPPYDDECDKTTKYGELVILGYNGCLPQGERGRRRSKFVLNKRTKANGVKKSKNHLIKSTQKSKHQDVSVEYAEDPETDMFQIGRSSEPSIDFIVGTIPSKRMKSEISRFAFRLIIERNQPSRVKIFASGFDKNRNIFLGHKSSKWREDLKVDGLTTNGVLIMTPKGQFSGGNGKCGSWRECSVGGDILTLRGSRFSNQHGHKVTVESNILQDGTLIDLSGVTLLWRSLEGLQHSPTKPNLENLIDEINAESPQCPGVLNTLVIPRKVALVEKMNQPYVFLNCGHVQGHHDWGQDRQTVNSRCPMCFQVGPTVTLCMGVEPAFYVDSGPPTYCFNPCGHMATERTVKYWGNVRIPYGTNGFRPICPFCATPLRGSPGYLKLIFQDNLDTTNLN